MPKRLQPETTIYVCGPTVYDEPHIGNIRPILTFDLVVRALRYQGVLVNFIHNITDVDDKIIDRARAEKTTEAALALRYEKSYLAILDELNIEPPTHMPHVMAQMKIIITFVQRLIATQHAYVHDGNVYFDVGSTPSYGSIANRKLADMQYEEKAIGKRHFADFALWKKTTIGVRFPSPWGEGRPGWHTECAAFIDSYLHGASLTIHGGGIDLLFPHHENENIQYLALHNRPIATTWRHVGHVDIAGTKMSKSIGNVIGAQDFITRHGADTMRYLFLASAYAAPLDLTDSIISEAKEMVERWRKAFAKSQLWSVRVARNTFTTDVAKALATWNFATALKMINAAIKDFHKLPDRATAMKVFNLMLLLGFAFSRKKLNPSIKALYNEWESYRMRGEFTLADALRERLRVYDLI